MRSCREKNPIPILGHARCLERTRSCRGESSVTVKVGGGIGGLD